MQTFNYVALGPKGEKIKDSVDAETEQSAAELIKKSGFTPIEIKSLSKSPMGQFTRKLARVKTKDKVLLARQLSTLINAGLPLVQSLRAVSEQTTSKALRVIIADVTKKVEGGSTFSDALAKHPKVFNQVFISLVAAGEASGTLDTTLDRLALQQEKDADIVGKVRGAMIYPAIVLTVMLLVVTFMLVKVLPQVEVLYVSFPGANLPIETKILLALSHFIVKFWYLVIIIVIGAGIGINRFNGTSSGKRVFDRLKLHMPPFGPLFQKIYMARFARIGSTLVAAGVPLLQVLSIVADAVNNDMISDSIHKASEKVKGGKSLSDALRGDTNFIPLVINMLDIGEQSGSMEKMLGKVADYYEKEVDDTIKNISALIEPVMMVLLGVMALMIVGAVLLPIYGLAGSGAIQF